MAAVEVKRCIVDFELESRAIGEETASTSDLAAVVYDKYSVVSFDTHFEQPVGSKTVVALAVDHTLEGHSQMEGHTELVAGMSFDGNDHTVALELESDIHHVFRLVLADHFCISAVAVPQPFALPLPLLGLCSLLS